MLTPCAPVSLKGTNARPIHQRARVSLNGTNARSIQIGSCGPDHSRNNRGGKANGYVLLIIHSFTTMNENPERKMFYGAKAITFIRARNLREKMTKSEIMLWEKLRNKQLLGFRFKAQHPVDCFIADFYCHKAKLVIEVDGKIHDKKVKYDRDRTAHFNSLGIRVLRFKNEEIEKDIDQIVETILTVLKTNI